MSISVVILQHGQSCLTRVALDSVRESCVPIAETLIVDNGSPCAADIDWLRTEPGITALLLGENEGYVRGTNEGWRWVRGDYIVLCNNDIALARSCIGRLARCLDDDPQLAWVSACYQWGGWGKCVTPFPDPIAAQLAQTQGQRRAEFNQWADGLTPDFRPAGITEATVFMVRKAASDQIGYFWNELHYHHVHDYSLRLHDAGWRMGICHDAVFWHHMTHPTIAATSETGINWNARRSDSTRLMINQWRERWMHLSA